MGGDTRELGRIAAVKNPARMLAIILSEECNVDVNETEVERMLVERWDELSFYAHAHHRQKHKRTGE